MVDNGKSHQQPHANMLSVDSQPLTHLTDRLRNLQHEGYSPNTGQYIWMYGKVTREKYI